MGTIDESDDAPSSGDMTWRDDLRIAAPILAIGLALFAGASAWLLTRDERGSGFLAIGALITPAFLIGVPSGLGGAVELLGHWWRRRRLLASYCVTAAIGLPCLLMPGVSMLGAAWHAADVADARAFIARRIAVVRAADPKRWPATQAAFAGGERVPRALACKGVWYQGRPTGDDFEIVLYEDTRGWGGAWFYNANHPEGNHSS